MAVTSLIVGESGSGKSASLRNFDTKEVLVFSLEKSRLPFKKKMNIVKNMPAMSYTERYEEIVSKAYKYQKVIKVFVIDDADYLMFFEQQDRVNEKGYDKFTEMADKFVRLKHEMDRLDDDVTVYFMMHSSIGDDGKARAHTVGKLIDNQLGTLEALFERCFYATIVDRRHVFATRSDGTNTAKTDMGMFDEEYIDNDLRLVDEKIREYYEMPSLEDIEKAKAKNEGKKEE